MTYVPYRAKKNFIFCYKGKDTEIDSLININGYFKLGETPGGSYGFGSKITIIDTNFTVFMFFNDGVFLTQIGDYQYPKNIQKYFAEVAENTKYGEKDLFYQAFNWGCYRISGDTIKTQYINHSSVFYPDWMLTEEWFKVLNRNTLKSIYRQKLYGDYKAQYDFRKNEGNKYTWYEKNYTLYPANFVPLSNLPNSDGWLKEKKWFWCNKSDYKSWKSEQRKK